MAKKLIDLKIGERFDYNGVTIEVVEQPQCLCNGCYFYMKISCDNTTCTPSFRSDYKSVIFKEVTK